MTNALTKSDLLHFTGSETWYRHGLANDILYTDGAQAGCREPSSSHGLGLVQLPGRDNHSS